MSFKGFSIFSSNVERNDFSNFGRGSPKEHFCENYFEIDPLVQEKLSFKSFSFFSSSGYFVQWSGTILAILVEAHPKNISGIFPFFFFFFF